MTRSGWRTLLVSGLFLFLAMPAGLWAQEPTWSSGWTAEDKSIGSLAIDPVTFGKTEVILYAGTTQRTVFKSIDGGAHWDAPITNPDVNNYVADFGIGSRVPGQAYSAVYAGMYGSGIRKSTDGGANWSDMTPDTTYTSNIEH